MGRGLGWGSGLAGLLVLKTRAEGTPDSTQAGINQRAELGTGE